LPAFTANGMAYAHHRAGGQSHACLNRPWPSSTQALAWHFSHHGQRRHAWLCPPARRVIANGRLRQKPAISITGIDVFPTEKWIIQNTLVVGKKADLPSGRAKPCRPKLVVAFFTHVLTWYQLYHGQRRHAWLCPPTR